jgi:hypothetical protein
MHHRPSASRAYLLVAGISAGLACGEAPLQRADPNFQATVAKPAYTKENGPVILIDAAHSNFHSAKGRYGPFAELLRNDGYVVRDSKDGFESGLAGASVMVVANAQGLNETNDSSAFNAPEIAALHRWVEAGGSLLLVVDHYPMGPAASRLGLAFGVTIGDGMVEDSIVFDSTSKDLSQLVFSRENGLLAEHPITAGRDTSERLTRVVSFTGTTLRGPPQATELLRFSSSALAYSAIPKIEKDGNTTRVSVTYGNPASALGQSQGLAFSAGKGRVVILGEAAMLTAQIDRMGKAFGMSVAGTDDKQFVLNVAHWLSRVIN